MHQSQNYVRCLFRVTFLRVLKCTLWVSLHSQNAQVHVIMHKNDEKL